MYKQEIARKKVFKAARYLGLKDIKTKSGVTKTMATRTAYFEAEGIDRHGNIVVFECRVVNDRLGTFYVAYLLLDKDREEIDAAWMVGENPAYMLEQMIECYHLASDRYKRWGNMEDFECI